MPLRLLTPYIEALPHVRAQASMQLAEAIAFGSGVLKKSARDDVAAGWRGALRRQPRRSRSAAELAANAAASGIGFRRVVVPPADGPDPGPSPRGRGRRAVTPAPAAADSPARVSRLRRRSS